MTVDTVELVRVTSADEHSPFIKICNRQIILSNLNCVQENSPLHAFDMVRQFVINIGTNKVMMDMYKRLIKKCLVCVYSSFSSSQIIGTDSDALLLPCVVRGAGHVEMLFAVIWETVGQSLGADAFDALNNSNKSYYGVSKLIADAVLQRVGLSNAHVAKELCYCISKSYCGITKQLLSNLMNKCCRSSTPLLDAMMGVEMPSADLVNNYNTDRDVLLCIQRWKHNIVHNESGIINVYHRQLLSTHVIYPIHSFWISMFSFLCSI